MKFPSRRATDSVKNERQISKPAISASSSHKSFYFWSRRGSSTTHMKTVSQESLIISQFQAGITRGKKVFSIKVDGVPVDVTKTHDIDRTPGYLILEKGSRSRPTVCSAIPPPNKQGDAESDKSDVFSSSHKIDTDGKPYRKVFSIPQDTIEAFTDVSINDSGALKNLGSESGTFGSQIYPDQSAVTNQKLVAELGTDDLSWKLPLTEMGSCYSNPSDFRNVNTLLKSSSDSIRRRSIQWTELIQFPRDETGSDKDSKNVTGSVKHSVEALDNRSIGDNTMFDRPRVEKINNKCNSAVTTDDNTKFDNTFDGPKIDLSKDKVSITLNNKQTDEMDNVYTRVCKQGFNICDIASDSVINPHRPTYEEIVTARYQPYKIVDLDSDRSPPPEMNLNAVFWSTLSEEQEAKHATRFIETVLNELDKSVSNEQHPLSLKNQKSEEQVLSNTSRYIETVLDKLHVTASEEQDHKLSMKSYKTEKVVSNSNTYIESVLNRVHLSSSKEHEAMAMISYKEEKKLSSSSNRCSLVSGVTFDIQNERVIDKDIGNSCDYIANPTTGSFGDVSVIMDSAKTRSRASSKNQLASDAGEYKLSQTGEKSNFVNASSSCRPDEIPDDFEQLCKDAFEQGINVLELVGTKQNRCPDSADIGISAKEISSASDQEVTYTVDVTDNDVTFVTEQADSNISGKITIFSQTPFDGRIVLCTMTRPTAENDKRCESICQEIELKASSHQPVVKMLGNVPRRTKEHSRRKFKCKIVVRADPTTRKHRHTFKLHIKKKIKEL